MAAREHTDHEIVELIKLLPVTLEIGEYKLYDTSMFAEFYPDLMDEYERKKGDWNETFYYATENLLPEPDNAHYARYLSEELADFFNWSDNPVLKEDFLSTFNQTERLREFFDTYEKIYDGIVAFLDELDSRLYEYGAKNLSPVLLNLCSEEYLINVESMQSLNIMVSSGVLRNYSSSRTIKRSREIRDTIYSQAWESGGFCYDADPDYSKLLPFDPFAADGFYDFLLDQYKIEFDTWEDQPLYNLKIIANLIPSLFYGCVDKDTILDFENVFKPSTVALLKNLSSVTESTIQEFLKKDEYPNEAKFLMVFLRTAFKWRRKTGEDPAKLIVEFFSLFINPELDSIHDDLLYHLINDIG